jgi:predicted regulator of Ras-like GTPase activity (Roadblock/LC7/MglB family)
MAEEDESTTDFEALQQKLQEIKKQDGIIGYILRGTKAASIDLKDPTKIIDYATLSSAVFDIATDMAEELQLNEVNSIVLETEQTKLLSMTIKNQRLSVFMEKTVDHNLVCIDLK